MTPVSVSPRAARLAPLASLDCSITDSRISTTDTPTLNSYFDCDQLSDMVDDSLFEITNTGCLSSSVFRRDGASEPQVPPTFLYSSYDYSASSRIPTAARAAAIRSQARPARQVVVHSSYSGGGGTALSNQNAPKSEPAGSKSRAHTSVTKTRRRSKAELRPPAEEQANRATGHHRSACGAKNPQHGTRRSRLGFSSFLGLFEHHSKEAAGDKDPGSKSVLNGSGNYKEKAADLSCPDKCHRSMRARDSIKLTNQRMLKTEAAGKQADSALAASRSCNDFRGDFQGPRAPGTELLLLGQSRGNMVHQRPISASHSSHSFRAGGQLPAKSARLIEQKGSSHSGEAPDSPRPAQRQPKSVKFSMLDQVLTRPMASGRPLTAAGGQPPTSIIKRPVVKSCAYAQTESSKNLDKLLAKYDENSELIREISEKLKLTDTIASPRSILDQLPTSDTQDDEMRQELRALLVAPDVVYKSSLSNGSDPDRPGSSPGGSAANQLSNNNKHRAFI